MLKRFTPILLVVCASGIFSAAAQAETTGPVWKILAVDSPTNFKPGDQSGADAIVITAVNVGGASTGCTAAQVAAEATGPSPRWSPLRPCPAGTAVVAPVAIGDSLPKGVKAVEVFGVNPYRDPISSLTTGSGYAEEEGPPYGLSCSLSPLPACTTSEPVDSGDTLIVTIRVHVETKVNGSGEVNEASVSGGGAVAASVSDPVTIGGTPAEYGVAKGGLLAATSTSQAGGHPNLTTEFFLNTINPIAEARGEACPGNGPAVCALSATLPDELRDARFDLPKGLLGSTVGMPRCTMADVSNEANCPRNTMVGTETLMLNVLGVRRVLTVAVYNIAPAPGEPLALAFDALFFPVRIDTSVLSDGEYNARVTVPDITAAAETLMSSTTIWGDPAEHNGPGPDVGAKTLKGFRFYQNDDQPQITFGGPGIEEFYETSVGHRETVYDKRVPLLSNPTQCSTPLTTMFETDSWEAPGNFGGERTEETSSGTATSCGELSFQAGVSMLPDTLEAGAPAGYSFDLTVPQNNEVGGLATAHVKRTSVTLPLGTVISPSAADGLGDCTSEQFYGPVAEQDQERPATPGDCPRDSQVGTVRVKSPDLEEALPGDVYLGAPECTGPGGVCTPQDAADGAMVHLYVQLVGEGEDGVVVKLEGKGRINQQTGQITTVFENTPQLPFSEFKLTLQGGERATLSNPRTCGDVTTTADLTPWSSPLTPDATPTSTFDVNENCFAPQFNPSFSAGTTSNQAGGFTPFTVSFGRGDDDEFLNGLQMRMPPGVLGMLSRVKLCEEPQANAGTCGPESQIGEVTVETGPGADPFLVKGGKVYITGPYKGAPYGLSIVVPAKAGPYTLAGTTGQGTVINRSSINVDPESSALTITSDPLPTELDGIPLQLRLVNVTVGTNNNFTFNPTNCNKLAIAGTLTSTEVASAKEASSYQVTNCGALKFQPKFTVSTSGKTSRADGASLDAKVSYPSTGQGTQANIAKFKVELPKQLPSPLTTLQKACTAAVFNANPAGCPEASNIGVARAVTPVLPGSLLGPVYFVSHGGEAFPSLVIVLQGDGVRVDLTAATFIKNGVTSSTFNTIPDVPVTSFELYLPERKYSALTALGNLCKSKLAMPTTIVAQNGIEIHESTKIAVTGCPKAKKATRASRARKSSHGKGGRS